jgi:hypothetical protein
LDYILPIIVETTKLLQGSKWFETSLVKNPSILHEVYQQRLLVPERNLTVTFFDVLRLAESVAFTKMV